MNGVRLVDNVKTFLAADLMKLTVLLHVFQQENAVTLIILMVISTAMDNAKHLLVVELMKLSVTLVKEMSVGMIPIVATLSLITGVQQVETTVLVFLRMNFAAQLKVKHIAQVKVSVMTLLPDLAVLLMSFGVRKIKSV